MVFVFSTLHLLQLPSERNHLKFPSGGILILFWGALWNQTLFASQSGAESAGCPGQAAKG